MGKMTFQYGVCCAVVLYLGCGARESQFDDLHADALRIVEFSRLPEAASRIIAAARNNTVGDIHTDTLAAFVADARADHAFGGDRVTAYSMKLPQKKGTEKPMDGSQGVPCWPELIVIMKNPDQSVERILVTLQCL